MNAETDMKSAVAGLGVGVLFAFGITGDRVHAAEGYEVMGHLSYTAFDASANPTRKRVIMFDVKVGKTWRIRTEPVIECLGGIAYHETFSETNNCIWALTAFEAAFKPSDSPFNKLRSALKKSKKDDVYFTNATLKLPDEATGSASKATSVDSAKNVAIATILSGKYPPMDSSYAAFLWFAFTPPSMQTDGTNQMLLQIWDDGNPRNSRFRRAKWTQFAEPPKLLSGAVYNWVGLQWLPDGTVAGMRSKDVLQPLEIAARYEVFGTTNLGNLVLPSSVKLTRYASKQSEDGKRRVLTTDVAVVTSVKRLFLNCRPSTLCRGSEPRWIGFSNEPP